MSQQSSLHVRLRRLADKRARAVRPVLLEPRGPALELLGRRASWAERRVDGEEQLVRHRGELGRTLEALRKRLTARGARDLGLKRSVSGVTRISREPSRPARSVSSVTSESESPPGVKTRSGRFVPSG